MNNEPYFCFDRHICSILSNRPLWFNIQYNAKWWDIKIVGMQRAIIIFVPVQCSQLPREEKYAFTNIHISIQCTLYSVQCTISSVFMKKNDQISDIAEVWRKKNLNKIPVSVALLQMHYLFAFNSLAFILFIFVLKLRFCKKCIHHIAFRTATK